MWIPVITPAALLGHTSGRFQQPFPQSGFPQVQSAFPQGAFPQKKILKMWIPVITLAALLGHTSRQFQLFNFKKKRYNL